MIYMFFRFKDENGKYVGVPSSERRKAWACVQILPGGWRSRFWYPHHGCPSNPSKPGKAWFKCDEVTIIEDPDEYFRIAHSNEKGCYYEGIGQGARVIWGSVNRRVHERIVQDGKEGGIFPYELQAWLEHKYFHCVPHILALKCSSSPSTSGLFISHFLVFLNNLVFQSP